jgi:hypothetical protein
MNTTSNTNIAALSEFDYFRQQILQASITNEYEEEIKCANLTAYGSTLDFEIPGEPNVYRDLSNSYLLVKCLVTKGEVLAATDAVAPVNNLLHSLFSDVEVSVCGTRLTDKESYYPYRAVMEQLLSASHEVLDTRAKLAGWELDTEPGDMDKITLAAAGDVNPNRAFVKRNQLIAGSRALSLVGRLHADLFHQDLDIPANCRINIKLTRSNHEFVLMASNNSRFKIELLEASLFVKSKEVVPEIIEAHREMLIENNFRIPFTQVGIKTVQISQGNTKVSYSDIFSGKLPKRIIVAMIKQERVTGKYELNPFKFENFNLSSIKLTVGGKSIPAIPLSMDYNTNDYQRAYLSTLSALDLDIANHGIALSPELWANAYNLYAFKLVPGPIQGSIESTRQRSAVNLSLEFRAGVAAPVEVLIYSETNRTLEITATNKAFVV